MKLVESLSELRRERGLLTGTVGFVPTMGALHQGHMSLVEKAKESCSQVLVSIFVNPTQFAPSEDLDSYPRTKEADIELCSASGVDLLWFPQVEELYPPGSQTIVRVEELGGKFEGASRPGHFQGVATVVTKLFHAVAPHQAFFGRKDLQQFHLLKQMSEDLLFPIEIVGVPTARDPNGLALSSRNALLQPTERVKAKALYEGLLRVRQKWDGGETSVKILDSAFRQVFADLPGAEIERLDFLSKNLSHRYQEGDRVEQGYCSVAVRYGGVRLIDNIELCS